MLRSSFLASAFALVATIAMVALAPSRARADALADFSEAEAAYRDQRYAQASTILEGVIATADTDSVDRAVLLESRKYLAACYLFLGRATDADRQFELLLAQEPDYRVDAAVFPREVVDRFEAVRRRFEAERAREREAAVAEAEARLAAERQRLEEERARYEELFQIAATSVVLRENSRVVAALPFGIGQFQNRRRRLGRFFAVAESLALGMYVGSYAWHQSLRDVQTEDELRWLNSLQALRIINWTAGAMFLSLAITGSVEAEVNFVPTRSSSIPRPIPERLAPNVRPVTRLGITPTALFLRVDF